VERFFLRPLVPACSMATPPSLSLPVTPSFPRPLVSFPCSTATVEASADALLPLMLAQQAQTQGLLQLLVHSLPGPRGPAPPLNGGWGPPGAATAAAQQYQQHAHHQGLLRQARQRFRGAVLAFWSEAGGPRCPQVRAVGTRGAGRVGRGGALGQAHCWRTSGSKGRRPRLLGQHRVPCGPQVSVVRTGGGVERGQVHRWCARRFPGVVLACATGCLVAHK